MNKSIILLFFLINVTAFSQVGIGTTTPDASSILDIKANPPAVGLLLPRLTTSERDASIKSPSAGLVIYNSTANTLEVAISGSLWVDVVNGTTTAAATGTSLSIGQVGIGTTTPNANAVLDVTSTNKGVLLPQSATDPAGVAGMIYYNTASNTVKLFNGASWIVLTN